ncbi:ATP-binding protein [Kibdelosporangium persicum]|nr:ATP-binding protein [Kibdelosporangium persicum]
MLDDTDPHISKSPAALRAWARQLPEPICETVLDADLSLPFLFHEVVAVNGALSPQRHAISGWARRLGFDGHHVEDMMLAVDEAVANAIEHGYRDRPADDPGIVMLFAASMPAQGMAHVVVADNGSWRPPTDSGFRGRGLSIIQKITNLFELHYDHTGTVTRMAWYLPS